MTSPLYMFTKEGTKYELLNVSLEDTVLDLKKRLIQEYSLKDVNGETIFPEDLIIIGSFDPRSIPENKREIRGRCLFLIISDEGNTLRKLREAEYLRAAQNRLVMGKLVSGKFVSGEEVSDPDFYVKHLSDTGISETQRVLYKNMEKRRNIRLNVARAGEFLPYDIAEEVGHNSKLAQGSARAKEAMSRQRAEPKGCGKKRTKRIRKRIYKRKSKSKNSKKGGANKRKTASFTSPVSVKRSESHQSIGLKQEYSSELLDTIELPKRVTNSNDFYQAVEDYIIDHYSFLTPSTGAPDPIVDARDTVNNCFVDIKVAPTNQSGRTVTTSYGQHNFLRRETVTQRQRYTINDNANVGYYLICRKKIADIKDNRYLVELLYAKIEDSSFMSPDHKRGSSVDYVGVLKRHL